MFKGGLVFIITIAVLISFVGCSPEKTESVTDAKERVSEAHTPPEIEPAEVEIPEIKPPHPEPSIIEPPKDEPVKTQPPKTEPPKTEPPKQEPPKIQPPPVVHVRPVAFYQKCADILSRFVNEKGMVDYKALKRKRQLLENLLSELAKLDRAEYEAWPKEDKIAFWINTYNMQMLKIIIKNYPIQSSRWLRVAWPPSSIRHIPPRGVIGTAKWNKYKFYVMEEEFTLSQIEQRFFRKEFNEPRAFLATTFASLSSPPLHNEPYYGRKLDKQLDDQAGKFFSSPRAFRIDRKRQRVYLSAIFEPTWYGKGFIGKYGTDKKFKDQQPATRAVLNFLTNHIPKQDSSFLQLENYSVKYINYDWRLNETN